MNGYKISEKQANAILDMKLSKLTSLESGALDSEKTELLGNIKNYIEILENENKVFQIIKEETKEIKAEVRKGEKDCNRKQCGYRGDRERGPHSR